MKELTMRSRLKKLRDTLSSMTLPKKLDHLWTYYKESLFAVFLVVVIIAVICTAVVQSGKETLISGIAANVYLSEGLQEHLTEGYLARLGAQTHQQAYLEQIRFSAPEGYDLEGSSLESSLSVLVMAGAGNLDYLLLDTFALEQFMEQQILLDLSAFLTPEELALWESRLVRVTYEETGATAIVAVDISSLPLVQQETVSDGPVFFALCESTPHPAACRDIWELLTQ